MSGNGTERDVIERRVFLRRMASAAAIAASPYGLSCAREAVQANGPNLLLIMADDLGFADLGIYGRRDFETPVLDGLAREGVRFAQAYSAAPVCSPTRVALMTGRYPARLEVGLYEPLTTHPTGLAADLPTLSRMLKDAGYETALIGKWHLGTLPAFHPQRHGFDEFFGHLGPAIDYISHINTESLEHDLYDGTREVHIEGYATDLFTQRALDWIRRPRSAPFFLSLQYNAPHWPWQAPGDPPYPDSLRWKGGGSATTYARMVRSMDEGVGRILDAVREMGLERDTLVIFTSDNGGEIYSDMGPHRALKLTLWEGGIRVAAFARWPGVIPSETVSSQVATTMDWTATLLATGGATWPADFPLDGIDLMPQMQGAAPAVTRDLYWRTFQRGRYKAMRSGDWKYLVTEQGEHLFDLAVDPGETSDRKDGEPAVFERLAAAFAQWENTVLEPIPLDPARA